jgi:hypothetical protein
MSKEQYHELSEYIIEYFTDLEKKLSIPIDIKYVYQADDKQKTLLKITKIPDRYSNLLNADILISFNEEFFDAFDNESRNILIDQELALVEYDLEKGIIKIGKPDLVTSTGVVKKYGMEAVERANNVKDLYNQQQEDKERDLKQNKKNNR